MSKLGQIAKDIWISEGDTVDFYGFFTRLEVSSLDWEMKICGNGRQSPCQRHSEWEYPKLCV
jgi:hypothetical protein